MTLIFPFLPFANKDIILYSLTNWTGIAGPYSIPVPPLGLSLQFLNIIYFILFIRSYSLYFTLLLKLLTSDSAVFFYAEQISPAARQRLPLVTGLVLRKSRVASPVQVLLVFVAPRRI